MKKAFNFLFVTTKAGFFLLTALLWSGVMYFVNNHYQITWEEIFVEADGMVFDLIVFGVVLTLYEALRERKEKKGQAFREKSQKIEHLIEEIDDYRGWDEKEAMYRNVGAIRRLNKLGVSKIDLSFSYLVQANLNKVELNGTNFEGANLENVNLGDANLKSATFSGERFGEFVLNDKVNLRGAYLNSAKLQEAKFECADLTGADLDNAKLQKASFYKADLTRALLSWSDLSGANLTEANLTEADLSGANLTGADLSGANLTGAIIYFFENEGVDEDDDEMKDIESRVTLINIELSNAIVDLDWFEKLQKWNIPGWKEIVSRYIMDENGLLVSR